MRPRVSFSPFPWGWPVGGCSAGYCGDCCSALAAARAFPHLDSYRSPPRRQPLSPQTHQWRSGPLRHRFQPSQPPRPKIRQQRQEASRQSLASTPQHEPLEDVCQLAEIRFGFHVQDEVEEPLVDAFVHDTDDNTAVFGDHLIEA